MAQAQLLKYTMAVADKPGGNGCLDFEKPLADLECQIAELQVLQKTKGIDYSPEIRQLQSNLVKLTGKIYKHLTAWETVQVARHPRRPLLKDYLQLIVKDFSQLHGDRHFGDDPAIITGFGRIGREKVMIIGHNKGRNMQEKTACHFGCAHPEGYRKAMLKMKLAEKFNLPIVCFIDTPGAYPGIGAEQRGQAQAIAYNMMEMSLLRVPVIGVVIGEGGSGGALGIGVCDRFAMLEYAYFSVISPEGCAAILWRDGAAAPKAAEALKLTSTDISNMGIADAVIPEPLGGAHRNWHEAGHNIENYLIKTIRTLRRYKIDNLLENRYQKLRSIGRFNMEKVTDATKKVLKTSVGKNIKEIPVSTKPARRKSIKNGNYTHPR